VIEAKATFNREIQVMACEGRIEKNLDKTGPLIRVMPCDDTESRPSDANLQRWEDISRQCNNPATKGDTPGVTVIGLGFGACGAALRLGGGPYACAGGFIAAIVTYGLLSKYNSNPFELAEPSSAVNACVEGNK
jgi:hypothetical protein